MKSIRHHLYVMLGISICVLLVTGGLGIFFVTRGILRDQFDDTLVAKATALITATEIDDGEFEIDLTVQDFAGFGAGGQDYFEIRRGDGSILAASPSLVLPARPLLPVLDGEPEASARIDSGKLLDGRPARFYLQTFIPKDDDAKRFQDLHLIAASPERDLQWSLWVLGSVIAGVGTLVVLSIFPLLGKVLRRGLRPLEDFGRQVREIPASRLDQHLDLTGKPAELLPLGETLNDWLGRLAASFERERRFNSNAAHELRTPLAELKMMAEMGATWPDQATPERFGEMGKVIDELEALIGKLSLLARADAGSQPVERVPVDLAASVAAAVGRFEGAAAARGLTIQTDVSEGSIPTDAVLWPAILNNLLGNAVSHAPPETTIRIQASPDRLEVANVAPEDLSEADLERLHERFWRKNPSHDGDGHSGLGLSIVKACVGLLGGSSRLTLDKSRVFRAEILWSAP